MTNSASSGPEPGAKAKCCPYRRAKRIHWRKTLTVEPVAFIYGMCLLLIQPASQRTLFTMICIRDFANGDISLLDFVANGSIVNATTNYSVVMYVTKENHSSSSSNVSTVPLTNDDSAYDYYYYYGDWPTSDTSATSNKSSQSSRNNSSLRNASSTSTLVAVNNPVSIDAFQFCTATIFEKTAASRRANNLVSASTSEWTLFNNLATTVPGLFTAALLGAYTDLHNRRRILFHLAFFATFVNASIYAIVAFSPIGLFSLYPNGTATSVAFTRSVPITTFVRYPVTVVPAIQTTYPTVLTRTTDAVSTSVTDYAYLAYDYAQSVTTAPPAYSPYQSTNIVNVTSTTDSMQDTNADSISWVPYELLLIGEFMEGALGGQSLVTASSFSYVSVIVHDTRARSWRITILQAVVYVGAGVGTLVSGFVMQELNSAYVYLIIAFFMVISALYTQFWLLELPPVSSNDAAEHVLEEAQVETESHVRSSPKSGRTTVDQFPNVDALRPTDSSPGSDAEDAKAVFTIDYTLSSRIDSQTLSGIVSSVPSTSDVANVDLNLKPGTTAAEQRSCWQTTVLLCHLAGSFILAAARAVFRSRATPRETAKFGLLMAAIFTFMLVLSADKSLSFLYLTGSTYGLSTSVYGLFTAGVYFFSCVALLAGLPPLRRALPRISAHWFALPGVVGKIVYLALLGAALSTDVYYLVLMVLATSLQSWTMATLRICIAHQVNRDEQTRVFGFMNACEVLLLSLGSLLFNYAIYPRTVSTFPAASFYVGAAIGVVMVIILLAFAWIARYPKTQQPATIAPAVANEIEDKCTDGYVLEQQMDTSHNRRDETNLHAEVPFEV